MCPIEKRQNTDVGGQSSFCPAFTVTLDLSIRQGLALHVLKELLKSFCVLEELRFSSLWTPALFISDMPI